MVTLKEKDTLTNVFFGDVVHMFANKVTWCQDV